MAAVVDPLWCQLCPGDCDWCPAAPPEVIVPFRDRGDPTRNRNLARVLQHLSALEWPVTVVSDGRVSGSFNRSAAYNRGVQKRSPTQVWVFHEADMIIPLHQLREAARIAAREPGLVVPFDVYRYLDEPVTQDVCADKMNPFAAPTERTMRPRTSTGAVNIVSDEAMRAVGCWDETFEGWGYDDRAMCQAFSVACRRPTRFVIGPGVHLWHQPGWAAGGKFAGGSQPAVGEMDATERNRVRWKTYQQARTPEQIRELTSQPVGSRP